jgi:hypothetical protein
MCTPSESSTDAKSDSIAEFSSSRTSSDFSFSSAWTKAPSTVSRRRLSAVPATLTRAPSARALKAVMGWATSVGIRTGKTLFARTCIHLLSNVPTRAHMITHAHDFLERLERRLGRFARVAHRLEQRRNGLVHSLGTDVVLHRVECPCGGGADRGLAVDKRVPDRRDDCVLVIGHDVLVGGRPESNSQCEAFVFSCTGNLIVMYTHMTSAKARQAPSFARGSCDVMAF